MHVLLQVEAGANILRTQCDIEKITCTSNAESENTEVAADAEEPMITASTAHTEHRTQIEFSEATLKVLERLLRRLKKAQEDRDFERVAGIERDIRKQMDKEKARLSSTLIPIKDPKVPVELETELTQTEKEDLATTIEWVEDTYGYGNLRNYIAVLPWTTDLTYFIGVATKDQTTMEVGASLSFGLYLGIAILYWIRLCSLHSDTTMNGKFRALDQIKAKGKWSHYWLYITPVLTTAFAGISLKSAICAEAAVDVWKPLEDGTEAITEAVVDATVAWNSTYWFAVVIGLTGVVITFISFFTWNRLCTNRICCNKK